MQRVWLLNGENINYDKDFTASILENMTGWIIEWFDISGSGASAEIEAGKALIECERTNGEKIMIFFENTANIAVDMSGTKKVYIEVDQSKIDDGSSNSEDGAGIGAITTDPSAYPTKNFVKLFDVVAWTPTDDRQVVKSRLLRTGLTTWRMFLSDNDGDEIEVALWPNWTVWTSTGTTSLPNWTAPSVNIVWLDEKTNVVDGDYFLVSDSEDLGANKKVSKENILNNVSLDKITTVDTTTIATGLSTDTVVQVALDGSNMSGEAVVKIDDVIFWQISSGEKDYFIWEADSTVKITTQDIWYNVPWITYQKSFSIGWQDSAMEGMSFKSDGTKMYLLGDTNNKVYQYTLSTAWDLASASYDSISFASIDIQPYWLFFSPDGTKMYICGINQDRVHQYTLSTAWDLSTASYDSKNFYTWGQEAVPSALFFKPDGTKMYICGNINDRVYQYSLSTAWDVSTASYDSKNFQLTNISWASSFFFNSTWWKMYGANLSDGNMYEYDLTTFWDVSTASYNSVTKNLSTPDVTAINFSTDWSLFYMLSKNTDAVTQWGSSWDSYNWTVFTSIVKNY